MLQYPKRFRLLLGLVDDGSIACLGEMAKRAKRGKRKWNGDAGKGMSFAIYLVVGSRGVASNSAISANPKSLPAEWCFLASYVRFNPTATPFALHTLIGIVDATSVFSLEPNTLHRAILYTLNSKGVRGKILETDTCGLRWCGCRCWCRSGKCEPNWPEISSAQKLQSAVSLFYQGSIL